MNKTPARFGVVYADGRIGHVGYTMRDMRAVVENARHFGKKASIVRLIATPRLGVSGHPITGSFDYVPGVVVEA